MGKAGVRSLRDTSSGHWEWYSTIFLRWTKLSGSMAKKSMADPVSPALITLPLMPGYQGSG